MKNKIFEFKNPNNPHVPLEREILLNGRSLGYMDQDEEGNVGGSYDYGSFSPEEEDRLIQEYKDHIEGR